MATVQDIRAWAEANGHELTGKGVSAVVRRAYDDAHSDSEPDMFSQSEPARDQGFDDVVEERPPVIKEPSTLDKARSIADRVKRAGPARKPRAVKARKPRVPVDRFISRGWQFIAQAMQPISMPTARVLDVQAPVAGLVLEDVIKGTVVDKILQPLARTEQAGEVVFALLGPPAIVAAIHRRPEAAPFLIPFLKEALRSWIDVAGDKVQIAKERDEKFEQEYGKKIDEMIGYFFQDMMEPAPTTVEGQVA